MSTYESKGLARYYLRTVTRRSGYLWLVLFLIMGLSMADMVQYAGLAEGASTATATVAATGALSGKILDQGGKPLTNIQVLALKQATTTDGGYYLAPLAPPYGLSIYPPWTPEGLRTGYGYGYGLYGYNPYSPYSYGYSFGNAGAPATDTSSLYRALSKVDGTFLLSNLTEGRYSLWAYDPQGRGFVPVIFGLNDSGVESKLLNYYSYSSQNVMIKVKSGQTAGPFSMTMTMGGKLSGRITDADTGSPIKGAIIQAYTQDQAGTGLSFLNSSDLNGNFTFSGLPEGKIVVNVNEADGYMPNPGQYYPSVEENTYIVTYSVVAGKETSGCKLALKRSGTISGKVTSQADGKPIAGAEISCFMTGSGGIYYGYQQSTMAISAADGTYHISGLDTCTCVPLILHAPGFQGAYYPNTQDPSKAKEIQVELGKETASINFQLIPSKTGKGTIRGRVIDKESGLPAAGIQVNLSQVQVYVSNPYAVYPSYGYAPYGTTSAPYGTTSASYRMKNRAKALALDSAPASASGGPNTYATTVYATTASATTAYAPTVVPSSVTEPMAAPTVPGDTVVAPATTMSTFINSLSYAPIPVEPTGSSLPSLSDVSYTYINPVWTDQEGKFEFTGLEYGQYSLYAYDPSGWYLYGYYPEYSSTTGYTTLPYIELSEKQSTSESIEITLRRAGCLEGKVLAGSTPLAGIQVMVIKTGGKDYNPYGYLYASVSSQDTTDTAGEFSIHGLEGDEYVLLAEDTTVFGNYATTYCLDTNALEEKPRVISITAGSSVTNLVISMKTGASITGKVVDKTGKPLAGIIVSATIDWNYASAGSDRYASLCYYYLPTRYAMTAEDGTYAVNGLSEGTYTLRTMDSNGEYQVDCCSGIKVAPPAKVSVPDLVLPKSMVLSGRVTSQDGQPLANIYVSASLNYSYIPAPGPEEYLSGPSSSSSSEYQKTYGDATTAEDGTYRITGLAAGSYQIDASDSAGEYVSGQYGAGSSSVVITGAEGEVKTNLDFHLNQGGKIKGTIRDAATGRPISGLTVTAQQEPVIYPCVTAVRYYNPYAATASSGQIYSSLPSDSQGNYSLHGLCAGKYRVYITDTAGKNYMSQYYAGASSTDEATVLEINTAQTIENIDFILSAGIIIKGTIKDAVTGQPITGSGCMVTLTNEQGVGVKQAYTGSFGEYKFTGIRPGTYCIHVGESQYYSYGYYFQIVTYQQAPIATITLSMPGPVEGIDILLQPKASISGRVVDEYDQKPLANITITAMQAVQGMGSSSGSSGSAAGSSSIYVDPSYSSPYYGYRSATTDADGRYTLKGVDEGSYMIMASDYSHIYGREYYKDVPANQPDKANLVSVGRSENKGGIDLALKVGETYTGADTGTTAGYYSTTSYASPYQTTSYASTYPTTSYAYTGSGYGGTNNSFPSTVSTQPSAEAPGNNPAPEIISSNSVEKITAGRTFNYQVKVNESAANTPLKYSLTHAPEGMNIDPDSGVVQWKPSNSDAGQAIVQLKVDNGSGQVALQAFRLGVEADTKPPEEVTALKAVKGDQKVTISWKPSVNHDGDLADQILYVKEGNAAYGAGISLGKTTARYTVKTLENGKAYTFKITTRDGLANESSGVTATATPAKEQAAYAGNQLTSWYPLSGLTSSGLTSGTFSSSYLFNMSNPSTAGLWGVLPSSTWSVTGATSSWTSSLWTNSNSLWTNSNSLWTNSTSSTLGLWNNSPVTSLWGTNSTTSSEGIFGTNSLWNSSLGYSNLFTNQDYQTRSLQPWVPYSSYAPSSSYAPYYLDSFVTEDYPGSDSFGRTNRIPYLPCTPDLPFGYGAKPVIYLYPQEDTQVSVKLDIDGEITKTIPPYNDGWYVLATVDGTITDEKQGKQYDYLFWEAKVHLDKSELPDKGWVVAQSNLEEWFKEYLPKLGLNQKEKEQFMEYWLDRLQGRNYYEMKLLSSSFLAEHAKLTINPSPDTLIRIIFHFTPLDEYKALDAPAIETPARKGFVVLEWGGILSE